LGALVEPDVYCRKAKSVSATFGRYFTRLPLLKSAVIRHGNALRIAPPMSLAIAEAEERAEMLEAALKRGLDDVEAGRVDDTFEVVNPGFERDVFELLSIGKPAATRVVAYDRIFARESFQPRPPRQTLPLVLEMGKPTRGHHQRRSFAADRIREFRPVRRGAEPDLLVHGSGD
jgi:hypothetical protein